MDVRTLVETKARAARAAARALALCSTRTKNEALTQMARGLEEKTGAHPGGQPRRSRAGARHPG